MQRKLPLKRATVEVTMTNIQSPGRTKIRGVPPCHHSRVWNDVTNNQYCSTCGTCASIQKARMRGGAVGEPLVSKGFEVEARIAAHQEFRKGSASAHR